MSKCCAVLIFIRILLNIPFRRLQRRFASELARQR
jgi:hypothetical protein